MDNTIALYLIKVSISLALFYGLYMLCLRTDTFFRLRRGYFIFAIFFSLLFPVFIIEIPLQEEVPVQVPVYWLSQIDIVAESGQGDQPVSVWIILFSVSATVSLLYAVKFLIQLFSVIKLRMSNDSESLHSCKLIKVKNKHISPFSFFKWIFINPKLTEGKELDEVIAHEQAHANQYHSVDVILIELLCICFWWNPFVWLLKKEIKINLEYLADACVLNAGYDSKEYQYILLQTTNKNTGIPLINNFNVSQLKKRIMMMNKNETSIGRATKYLLAVPVVFALLLGNAVQASPDIADMISIPFIDVIEGDQVPQKKGDVYTTVDEMPSFPGGLDAQSRFISQNLKYPVSAFEKGIEGRVTVRYVVKSTGDIATVAVIRGVDPSLDKEAVRVVEAMPKWNPGKKDGKAVDVYYTLPIVFKLTKSKSVANEPVVTVKELSEGSSKNTSEMNPFITVEDMPRYPGGEEAMQKYVADNLKYPETAQKAGMQGRVTIRFVVGQTGKITDVMVIRGIDPACDAEAVRVVKAMPDWVPGKQNGVVVPVYYTLPIVFRLKKDTVETAN